MKKTAFFTGKSKRKLPKPHRSGSNENLRSVLYSTDPKDLPDGFTVGSMSVAYVPPQQRAQEASPPVSQKKKPKHHKTSKEHQESPLVLSKASPVVSQRIAIVASATAKLDSNETHELSGGIKVSNPTLRDRQADWATKGRLQRSCSVDALNPLIDDKEETKTKTVDIPGTRRFSTETENIIQSCYKRGISYNPDSMRRQIQRPNSSFHEPYSVKSEKPLIHTYISHTETTLTRTNPQRILHEPKSVEHLMEALQSSEVNVNLLDEVTGNAPIHSIIRHMKKKKDRVECLLALLTNSNVDIDLQNRRSMTALHLAIEVRCEMCIKAAIVFGADINKEGCNQFTPLDLVISDGTLPSIETTLLDLGAKGSTQKMAECRQQKKIPRLYSFAEKIKPPKKKERLNANNKISEFVRNKGVQELYNELEISVIRRMSVSATIGGADDAYALVLQQRELALYNKTRPKPKKNVGVGFGIRGGSRILCLDGGGIKGLSQLQVLIELEERTQSKITDLFDWIVGTSTGAVIALALVYGKKTLVELRQLYFLMKNRIFQKSRYGYGYNSEALEDILKQYLKEDIRMSDVIHPKVLIAAVNKETTNLELHFFNNCFNDEYSNELVWKVARYTSAAPMFFNEFENYVDGGVICNNPTDYGLTAIQNYCRLTGNKIPIAAVVSVGTGTFPATKMGNVDAQEALFFGKQWLKPGKLINKTQSLLSLLSNALLESEMVARNSESRCKEQDIPFFRFSPKFEELIAAGETDNEKLFNMVVRTMEDLRSKQKQLDELINIFQAVAESSQDLSKETIAEEKSESQGQHTVSDSIQEEEEEEEEEDEALNTTTEQMEQERKSKLGLNEEKSPQETVKMKLERISTASSELTKEVPTTPLRELDQNDPTPLFDDVAEDEDESIAQLVESIREENESHPQPGQGEFSENFLFNSINGQLKKMNSEHQLDSASLTEPIAPINSPLGIESGVRDKALLPNHPMKTQSQGNLYDGITVHSQQSAQDKGGTFHSQQSTPTLYKPYRTDTNEMDESHDEYTPYQRQTLV